MSEQIFDYKTLGLNTIACLNCQPTTFFWKWIQHTACVYKDDDGAMWVYESTQRKGGGGVVLLPFDVWLAGRSGRVYVRKMECFVCEDTIRGIIQRNMLRHINEYKGTPYPNLKKRAGRFVLYRSVIDGKWLPIPKSWYENPYLYPWPWFFCTHLYADVCKECALIDDIEYPDFNPAEMEPDNLRPAGTKVSGAGLFDKYLVDKVYLSREIRIK